MIVKGNVNVDYVDAIKRTYANPIFREQFIPWLEENLADEMNGLIACTDNNDILRIKQGRVGMLKDIIDIVKKYGEKT
jgi:hypothetical protein